jgi:hypothetical protein
VFVKSTPEKRRIRLKYKHLSPFQLNIKPSKEVNHFFEKKSGLNDSYGMEQKQILVKFSNSIAMFKTYLVVIQAHC